MPVCLLHRVEDAASLGQGPHVALFNDKLLVLLQHACHPAVGCMRACGRVVAQAMEERNGYRCLQEVRDEPRFAERGAVRALVGWVGQGKCSQRDKRRTQVAF